MTSTGHSALNSAAVVLASVLALSTTALAQECGDVNGSNTVTASDALAVLSKAVGIDPGLVCTGDCAELEPRVAALESLLANVSVDGSSLVVTGMNIQLVDGTGDTDGEPNGLGNLIVGYNEGTQGQTRTGSHNLIIGREHDYQSYGGLLAGYGNILVGTEASIVGGTSNIANGARATVLGGSFNSAAGFGSAIGGGLLNSASGAHSTVGGGESNIASGVRSTLSGGLQRDVTGTSDWGAGSLFEED